MGPPEAGGERRDFPWLFALEGGCYHPSIRYHPRTSDVTFQHNSDVPEQQPSPYAAR